VTCALGVTWIVGATIISLGGIILLPLFLLFWIYYRIGATAMDIIHKQQQQRLRLLASTQTLEIQDITFGELVMALLVFILSLPSTGVLVCTLTVLKSPFVIISTVLSLSYSSLKGIHRINPNSICGSWWLWLYPLFLIGFCLGVPIIISMVLFSIIFKILLAGLWPAYVASGWIRTARARRLQPVVRNPFTALNQARIASYQVIWFSDAVTNLAMYYNSYQHDNYYDNYNSFLKELRELACGERTELSLELKNLSMFPPPTMIGILTNRNNWQIEVALIRNRIATNLGTDPRILQKIWNSFFQQTRKIGKENIENQLLTKDYLMEIPPAVTIGLSQLVIFACIVKTLELDRSNRRNEFVLSFSTQNTDQPWSSEETQILNASSEDFILTDGNRPKGQQFATDIWHKMIKMKKIYYQYLLSLSADESSLEHNMDIAKEKAIFQAIILSAGEPFDDLPSEFQALFEKNGISKNMDFEVEFFRKVHRREKLLELRNLLNDVALRVAKHRQFKN
jgi:hypothetical protein